MATSTATLKLPRGPYGLRRGSLVVTFAAELSEDQLVLTQREVRVEPRDIKSHDVYFSPRVLRFRLVRRSSAALTLESPDGERVVLVSSS